MSPLTFIKGVDYFNSAATHQMGVWRLVMLAPFYSIVQEGKTGRMWKTLSVWVSPFHSPFTIFSLSGSNYFEERNIVQNLAETWYQESHCSFFKTGDFFKLPENKSAGQVDQVFYTQTLQDNLSQDKQDRPGGTQNKIGFEKCGEYPLWLILPDMRFNLSHNSRVSFTFHGKWSSWHLKQEDLTLRSRLPRGCLNRLDKKKWLKRPLRSIFLDLNNCLFPTILNLNFIINNR